MSGERIDLIRQVLDHPLIDADGVPCGIVDDLEMVGSPGKVFEVTALLVGPGAWIPRLPSLVSFIAASVLGREFTRVPWQQIEHIGEHIQLKKSASALGLGKADRAVARWLAWIPGSERKAD